MVNRVSRDRKVATADNRIEIVKAGQSVAGAALVQVKPKLLLGARIVFDELGKLLVAHGVPIQVADRMLRAAYVREAAKVVRSGWGQEPNVSQISVRTGLDRHLVRAILDDESNALRIPAGRRDSITRVTEGWISDPRFSTRKGPRDLRMDNKARKQPSVRSLINRYAPGISPRLVIEELLRMNLAKLLPDEKLRWVGGSSRRQQSLPSETAEDTARNELRSTLAAFMGCHS
jgi:hypothetical protein